MLAVDSVKRITISEIARHPFFTTDLPNYLKPLPPRLGPALGTLVTPPKAIDFEIIEGLGRIEEDVVEELAARLEGVKEEEVWECLRRDDGIKGKSVKVAYLLLRDKRRQGRDRKRVLLLTGFFSSSSSGQVRGKSRCYRRHPTRHGVVLQFNRRKIG
jgi:carbon catabolite-derepressing protein kinase